MPCGHVKRSVPCTTAFEWAALEGAAEERCSSAVAFSSPLCGHSVQLPCWAKTSQTWDTFQSPVARHAAEEGKAENEGSLLSEAALKETEALPADLAKAIRGCCQQIATVSSAATAPPQAASEPAVNGSACIHRTRKLRPTHPGA